MFPHCATKVSVFAGTERVGGGRRLLDQVFVPVRPLFELAQLAGVPVAADLLFGNVRKGAAKLGLDLGIFHRGVRSVRTDKRR